MKSVQISQTALGYLHTNSDSNHLYTKQNHHRYLYFNAVFTAHRLLCQFGMILTMFSNDYVQIFLPKVSDKKSNIIDIKL